jgi:hypothetical protein
MKPELTSLIKISQKEMIRKVSGRTRLKQNAEDFIFFIHSKIRV